MHVGSESNFVTVNSAQEVCSSVDMILSYFFISIRASIMMTLHFFYFSRVWVFDKKIVVNIHSGLEIPCKYKFIPTQYCLGINMMKSGLDPNNKSCIQRFSRSLN